ncbi:alpha/beta hydrolase-fold protein [Rothia sp. LK2588]|uniref:alpha/beta hydrolase n=1 Tax=Rothia sp. LK2588 TaxID=3114369 RepID=UPI0034CF1DFA
MEITGALFVTIVCVAAGLSLVTTIILIPHHTWHRPVFKFVAQTVSVLVTCLLILAAVGAILNAQNHWFGSWSSLFTPPSAQSLTQTTYGAELPRVQPAGHLVTGEPTSLQRDPAHNPHLTGEIPADRSRGVYMHASVGGAVSHENHDVLIWLPPSYFTDPHRYFPVIMGFTGFPGATSNYSEAIDYGDMVLEQVHAGKMQEPIVVVPDVSPGQLDSECVDGTAKDSPRVETFVIKDLVPWLQQNLRTHHERDGWATTGYSAGGWCATMFTMRHPEVFSAGMSQSGYFTPIYTEDQQWNDPHDPRYLLGDLVSRERPDVTLLFYTALDDPLATSGLREFSAHVTAPTSLVVDTIKVGGHRTQVWVRGIPDQLEKLAHAAPGFAAVKA